MPADIYTTIAGDYWDAIAYKVYGDETLMHRLLAANPAQRGVLRFGAGVEITCPDVEVEVSNKVPPWRR